MTRPKSAPRGAPKRDELGRPVDGAGRALDEFGLPLNGPARADALAALGRPDPLENPDAWPAPEAPAATDEPKEA